MSMGNDIILLEQVRVASPCHAAWEAMQGDDRVRYCDQCRLDVYNLSGLEVREAAALVRQTERRLCRRFGSGTPPKPLQRGTPARSAHCLGYSARIMGCCRISRTG